MVEHVKFYSKTNIEFYQFLKMIFSYDKQVIYQAIIILFFILVDQYSIPIVSLTMEIYSPTVDGDVITKWDKEFATEMRYSDM